MIGPSSGVVLGAAAPSQDFCDPFTGGNRYVPGSSRAPSIDAAPMDNANLGEVSLSIDQSEAITRSFDLQCYSAMTAGEAHSVHG